MALVPLWEQTFRHGPLGGVGGGLRYAFGMPISQKHRRVARVSGDDLAAVSAGRT